MNGLGRSRVSLNPYSFSATSRAHLLLSWKVTSTLVSASNRGLEVGCVQQQPLCKFWEQTAGNTLAYTIKYLRQALPSRAYIAKSMPRTKLCFDPSLGYSLPCICVLRTCGIHIQINWFKRNSPISVQVHQMILHSFAISVRTSRLRLLWRPSRVICAIRCLYHLRAIISVNLALPAIMIQFSETQCHVLVCCWSLLGQTFVRTTAR